MTGFIVKDHLGSEGHCGQFGKKFSPDQVIPGESGFAEVIYVLTRHSYCFLSILGQVQGVIGRGDINTPYMRMWLFGIITLTEMRMTELFKSYFKDDGWHKYIPEARLKAARDLQMERRRLNQHYELIDCLQTKVC